MEDVIYCRCYSDPIKEIPLNDFFSSNDGRVKNIVVWDVNEKEYWEGLQVITGHHYRVILREELPDLEGALATLFKIGAYYTYDPLDRSGN